MQRQKREDANDPHKSLDFGLGDTPLDKTNPGRPQGSTSMGKDHQSRHAQQMSMDMNLSSPYLLPPGLQSSRDSLDSLARSLKQNEDPYRPVTSYRNSGIGSVKSFQRAPVGGPLSPGLNKEQNPFSSASSFDAPSRQNSMPKSPPPPPEPAHMKPERAIIENADSPPSLPLKDPFGSSAELVMPDFDSVPYPTDDSSDSSVPTARQIARTPTIAHSVAETESDAEIEVVGREAVLDHADGHQMSQPDKPFKGFSEGRSSVVPAPLAVGSLTQASPALPLVEEPEAHVPQILTAEPSQVDAEEPRGRSMNRQSQFTQQALGVPGQDQRRLSVGLRPLPPDEFVDSEDPETRANRIRSFYKEYFEESKPEPMPAPASMPKQQPQTRPQPQPQVAQVDYYEDYAAPYLADSAAYYDPDTNAFVMPYAQPVARRAMTPPPSGSRFPGPRPPRMQHMQHGSIGGMSMPGGHGPFRPGSAASSNLGPRPGSSVSNMGGRPRAGSSYSSGGRWGAPRKPMPPPSTLSNLPNPSKLRDDSVALLGSIEFAPPSNFKDQAAGRPQSPAMDKRPYQLNVPAHSPLINSFDELPALPSP